MGLLCVLERKFELRAQPQFAGGNPAEQVGGALLEIGARRDVVRERRSRQKERTLLAEQPADRTAATAPLDCPNSTSMPRGTRQFRLFKNVVCPTES